MLAYKPEDQAWSMADDVKTFERGPLVVHNDHRDRNQDWIGYDSFISWRDLKKSHLSPSGSFRMEIYGNLLQEKYTARTNL